MALATTDYGPFFHDNTGFVGQGTSPYVTGSFTPPDNSLLVVVVATSGETASLDTDCVLTGGSLTWTKRISKLADWDGAEGALVQIWTAPVTTGASMTLTVTHTGHDQYSMYVIPRAYTGHDTTTPTGVTGTGESRTTSVSLTLSGAPATDSEVIAAIAVLPEADAGLTFTPGSSFTEITSPYSNNSFYSPQTQRRTGSTSTAVSWTTGTAAANPFDNKAAAALEIKAAAGGAPVDGAASAAGVGTVAAIGAAFASGDAATAGIGTISAVGESIVSAVFTLAGSGDVLGVGATDSFSDAVFALAGAGTATAVGEATASADALLAGTGNAAGEGSAIASAVFGAAGTGDALGVGQAITSFSDADFSISGIGTVLGAGAAIADAAALAAGAGNAAGVGSGGLVIVPDVPAVIAVGGGAGMIIPGMGPADRPAKKKKRKPRTYVMKIGDWPDEDDAPIEVPVDPDADLDAVMAELGFKDNGDDDDAAMALIMSLAA